MPMHYATSNESELHEEDEIMNECKSSMLDASPESSPIQVEKCLPMSLEAPKAGHETSC